MRRETPEENLNVLEHGVQLFTFNMTKARAASIIDRLFQRQDMNSVVPVDHTFSLTYLESVYN